jgi:methyl coenzyme M reductase gamma subunit
MLNTKLFVIPVQTGAQALSLHGYKVTRNNTGQVLNSLQKSCYSGHTTYLR